jgi:hypothetical protein
VLYAPQVNWYGDTLTSYTEATTEFVHVATEVLKTATSAPKIEIRSDPGMKQALADLDRHLMAQLREPRATPRRMVLDEDQFAQLRSAVAGVETTAAVVAANQRALIESSSSNTQRLVDAVSESKQATAALQQPVESAAKQGDCSAEWQRTLNTRNGLQRVIHWVAGSKNPCVP